MTNRAIAIGALIAVSLIVFARGGAHAAIVCSDDFQAVNGQWVSTPYCREKNLARVARSYGFKVSDEAIRYNESTKAAVCRAIGYDIRVTDICALYRNDGGSLRR